MKTPLGWQVKSLYQVAKVRSGLTKTSKRQGKTVKKPYVRVANVQDGFLNLTDIKQIDVPVGSVERFALKKWDFLLVEGNGNPENLGRGCSWDEQIPECVHQNHVFAVRVTDKQMLRPEFFAVLMQSEHVRKYFLSCAKSSSGLATLNSEQIKQCQLLIPSYREQAEIYNLHSAWEKAIEKAERLIAAKEKQLITSANK